MIIDNPNFKDQKHLEENLQIIQRIAIVQNLYSLDNFKRL
jgi:hypothetical protein